MNPLRPQTFRGAVVRMLWQTPLWAIPFALFFGTLFGGTLAVYKGSYLVSLIFAATIRLALLGLRFGIIAPMRRRARGRGANLPVEIALYSGCAILASFLAAFIVHKTIFPGFLGTPRAFAVTGMYAILFSTLIGGVAYATHFYHESIARAREAAEARAALAQAELRALRAQVQPHFLFNTLNSIAALIPIDPSAAEEMTTRLSELFRHGLSASERETTSLKDELSFELAYLDIERARFGGRLKVETLVEPGLESVPVPSLLLQPVVENAVRHAISPRESGGTVRLTARRAGNALVLAVEDDGPGMSPEAASAALGEGTARTPGGRGFGLFALRERLRASGLERALAIERPQSGGTRVVVTLPLTERTPS
jgi:signal transduction histidine kinase